MPLKKIRKIIFPSLLLIILMGFFIVAKNGYAQETFGLEYSTALNLGTRDLRAIIMSVINVLLGFLGIVAIIIILYGGYVYMTSAGDPNKIEKAKKILINGAIRLAIILCSWGIVLFIFRLFGVGGGGGGPGGGGGVSIGPGALGRGIIESHYPTRNQQDVPRNTMIVVTFKEEIKPETIINDTNLNSIYGDCLPGPVCDTLFDEVPIDGIADSIKIFKNIDGETGSLAAKDVEVLTNDRKTFVFRPVEPLGSAIEEFWYTVRLKDNIEKIGGKAAFPTAIGGVGYEWQFEVSTILDITPPQIESIVPFPDDSADTYTATVSTQAIGNITVVSQPNTYIASSIGSVNILAGTINATVSGSYSGDANNVITVTVNAGAVDVNVNWSATTTNNNSNAIINSNSVALGSGLSLIMDPGYAPGNQWSFNVTAEVSADYLRVGSTNYKFVASGASGNQINLGATVADTASNIANKIDEQLIIETPIVVGNSVNITAATAGAAGNSIALVYNSPDGATALSIIPMSGGADAGQGQTINDKKDEPRNVVVQINFNEAVSPITSTGEVKINGGLTVGPILDVISFNIILPSIDLTATGKNYIAGNWVISNGYHTVEFITKEKCGVNSCGEDVYCLPTDPDNIAIPPDLTLGNILIETKAASCSANPPTADFPFDGIIDMAANSLDGNRDGKAVGPGGDYNENTDLGPGDNYLWKFWVNSKVDLTPPVIEEIFPNINGIINLTDPIEIKFSKLMMSSTLKPDSGYADGKNHIALIDTSINPAGYWITSQNIDESIPPDGIPDKTKAFIKHTPFMPSTNYSAEAGEGVRDLYQNCFMPAADSFSACVGATPTWRSCCNGVLKDADECL